MRSTRRHLVVRLVELALDHAHLEVLDLRLEAVHHGQVLVHHAVHERVGDPRRPLLQELRVALDLRVRGRDRAHLLVVRMRDEEVVADEDVELRERHRDVAPGHVLLEHPVHDELHVVAEVFHLRDADVVPDVLHRERVDLQHVVQEALDGRVVVVELHPEPLLCRMCRGDLVDVRALDGGLAVEDQRLQRSHAVLRTPSRSRRKAARSGVR